MRNQRVHSDYLVDTDKRKPFPPRTGIPLAIDIERASSAAAGELEHLRLQVDTLIAANNALRRQIKQLEALLNRKTKTRNDDADSFV